MGSETNNRDVRWGIIGCGDVTEKKSGPAFSKAPGSSLVAVMRRNAELARDYATRHGVPRWYNCVDDLICDPGVDAVYVATPVGSHCEIACKVARAGKPAYVEKPMARCADECAAMIEEFRRAGVPLFVAYYRRKLPRFELVASMISEGVVGRVSGVRYHYGASWNTKNLDPLPWRLDLVQSGGGIFLDVGCHVLDLVDHLFGPIRVLHGAARNVASAYFPEDCVSMVFEVAGVLGVASWNFAQGEREDCLEVIGTDGVMRFAVFGDAPIEVVRGGKVESISIANPEHIQQPMIQSVVDCILGIGDCPSTGESAIRTSRVMDSVLSDYYGGRDREFWVRHK
ncbi:MAG: Gfo/Idh/MocA family oxidoreductase [Polyangiaceae bacterium]|nr:Gfo/Idh/MocA family oxidoreductase [Polyangiaceae bacterium]